MINIKKWLTNILHRVILNVERPDRKGERAMEEHKRAQRLLGLARCIRLLALAVAAVSALFAVGLAIQGVRVLATGTDGGVGLSVNWLGGRPVITRENHVLAGLSLLLAAAGLALTAAAYGRLGGLCALTQRSGTPFVPAAARLLGGMAWLFLAKWAMGLLSQLAAVGAEALRTGRGPSFSLQLGGGDLLLLLTLFALALVFRDGAALQQQADETL